MIPSFEQSEDIVLSSIRLSKDISANYQTYAISHDRFQHSLLEAAPRDKGIGLALVFLAPSKIHGARNTRSVLNMSSRMFHMLAYKNVLHQSNRIKLRRTHQNRLVCQTCN